MKTKIYDFLYPAIICDTTYNCRKVYCKGERLRKCSFEIRIQPPKPKIARKMKQSTDNMQLCGGLSTFENRIQEKG